MVLRSFSLLGLYSLIRTVRMKNRFKYPPQLSSNERLLMDLIWSEGPVARREIAEASHLTGASVTRLTKKLLDHGLLLEQIEHSGDKGQPRKPLSIAPDGAYAIGVYFSHQHLEVGLVDLCGNPIEIISHSLSSTSVAEIYKATKTCIRKLTEVAPSTIQKAIGIGFSLPGDFIGSGAKINAHAYFPELMHVDLVEELKSRFDYPIYAENDAACAALGERIHGAGRTKNNFLFVHIGHGIGSGIIIDGDLYRGSFGNSGIIGVQYPNDRPRPSGQDLFDYLGRHGIEARDFDSLQGLDPKTCPPLKKWIRRAAKQLVIGISITARVLDPDAIILGGRLPLHIVNSLLDEIRNLGYCNEGVQLPIPELCSTSLGTKAGVIGSACLAFSHHFFHHSNSSSLSNSK